ncbi:MAG: DUF3667 domain-containing protein [Planctomycetota bacterium]|jgi:hypothetical protein
MAKEPLVPQPDSGARKCPNCHAVATHAYCPKCGQPTHGIRASFRDLVADFFTVWFGAEAKSWRSLRTMFRRPGMLVLEYQNGRRARYVPPLRFYLFLSLSLLLVLKLMGNLTPDSTFRINGNSSTEVPDLAEEDVGEMEQAILDSGLDPESWYQGPIRKVLLERTHRLDRMSGAMGAQLIAKEMVANLPVALLLVLPFFALFLRILWFRSGFIYFDHFIFALQFQSFLFALMLIITLTPLPGWVEGWTFGLYPPIYLTLAQLRVTGRTIKRCVFNTLVLGPLLAATLLAMVIGLAAVSFLTF